MFKFKSQIYNWMYNTFFIPITKERAFNKFINEYFTQDNLSTAYPIYFVIKDTKWVSSYHFNESERFIAINDDHQTIAIADSLKKLFDEIKKHFEEYDNPLPENSDYTFIEEGYNSFLNGINVFGEVNIWEHKNMFLLSSEAHNHLKRNKHHYSSLAHVYCLHSWRSSETSMFFKYLQDVYIKNKSIHHKIG